MSATNASATVTYTATDTGGSGVKTVDPYASGPTDSGSYSKVATVTSGAASGNFSAYSFSEGEGTYSFYTRATDNATNLENAPGSADTTIVYDTTKPVSAAGNGGVSATNASSATVTYTATDTGGSGVKTVDLYASGPTDSGSYSKVATVTSGAASGKAFSPTPSARARGSYSFTPGQPTTPPTSKRTGSADTTIVYDTTIAGLGRR